MGGFALFRYFAIQLHLLYVCGKSKVSFIMFRFFSLLSLALTMQDSHRSLYSTKRIEICTFLIDSDSVQKMLITLLKLVLNTQKGAWIIFFKYQGKMFLNIEKILVKINEKQPDCTTLLVFSPFFPAHYFLQCIKHMTISIAIMHVTLSVVAMYVPVSSSNFAFLCLTDTHFS